MIKQWYYLPKKLITKEKINKERKAFLSWVGRIKVREKMKREVWECETKNLCNIEFIEWISELKNEQSPTTWLLNILKN